MGAGIAQLAASSAFPTILYEVNKEVLGKAKETIDGNLKLLVEKNKITPDQREKIFKNIPHICTLIRAWAKPQPFCEEPSIMT